MGSTGQQQVTQDLDLIPAAKQLQQMSNDHVAGLIAGERITLLGTGCGRTTIGVRLEVDLPQHNSDIELISVPASKATEALCIFAAFATLRRMSDEQIAALVSGNKVTKSVADSGVMTIGVTLDVDLPTEDTGITFSSMPLDRV